MDSELTLNRHWSICASLNLHITMTIHDTIIAFSLLVMNNFLLMFSLQHSVIARRKLRGIASCSKNLVPLCPHCVPLHNFRCPLNSYTFYICIFISDNLCQVISVNLIKHYKLISFLINMHTLHGNNMDSSNSGLNVVFNNLPHKSDLHLYPSIFISGL